MCCVLAEANDTIVPVEADDEEPRDKRGSSSGGYGSSGPVTIPNIPSSSYSTHDTAPSSSSYSSSGASSGASSYGSSSSAPSYGSSGSSGSSSHYGQSSSTPSAASLAQQAANQAKAAQNAQAGGINLIKNMIYTNV